MMNRCSLLVMAAVLVVAINALPKEASRKNTAPTRPNYIGCVDSSECGAGNCCVIGMGRFSIPTCQSVQEMKGACRPYGHELLNTTVSYPDGASLLLTNVYRLFCPCAANLACDLDSSTCQDPIDNPNYIYNSVIV